MASRSAFKICVTHEGYSNFFVKIRNGEKPEGLAAPVNPNSVFTHDSWSFDSPVHPQLSGQPVGDGAQEDWAVSYRLQPARLPVAIAPSFSSPHCNEES
jgi:hypothetical protein